eukprot:gb/GEZN01009939.1/.p1 GENE.gb/GEZN01009939.1/~~gb/GEZN01009939.1/.p1  ORF type:complete len:258 (-),score=33.92 gb/GEZN01009939.1/:227-1000(-)
MSKHGWRDTPPQTSRIQPLRLSEDRKHKSGSTTSAQDKDHISFAADSSKPPIVSYLSEGSLGGEGSSGGSSLDGLVESDHSSFSDIPKSPLYGGQGNLSGLSGFADNDYFDGVGQPHPSGLGAGVGLGVHPPNTVIVFGFPRDRADTVLAWMQKEGEVIRRQDDAGNWTYLTYASPLQMKWAEEQNGVILEHNLMIGVKCASLQPEALQEDEPEENPIFKQSQERAVWSGSANYSTDRFPQVRRSAWVNFLEHVLNW